MKNKFNFQSALLVLAFSAIIGAYPGVAATKPSQPKVGDCHLLTMVELWALNSSKKAVNCSKEHSAETYRVALWKGAKDPNRLFEVVRRPLLESLCQSWKIKSSQFTSWSYKLPTSVQWKAGARWIRCDAYSQLEGEPANIITYKGKKLNFK